VKTTLEIPDPVFRKAKAKAAAEGVSLRQFVTEAVERKLREGAESDKTPSEKPWMKSFGGLRRFHKENVRIQKIIDEEFEKIDPEDLMSFPRQSGVGF
jgi:hypothetical protein